MFWLFTTYDQCQPLRSLTLLAAAAVQVIGRLAANLSVLLQGKDKPVYAPHKDVGDICVVVNAEKAVFTGNKWEGKLYRWHTGVHQAAAAAAAAVAAGSVCCMLLDNVAACRKAAVVYPHARFRLSTRHVRAIAVYCLGCNLFPAAN
jgi:large subunit ribosomal protein L13